MLHYRNNTYDCPTDSGKQIDMLIVYVMSSVPAIISAILGTSDISADTRAICLASGMPENGHLDTLELNDELEDLILEGFERAGLSDKIELHVGDCKETLMRFSENIGDNLYDVVYIDANKREYCEYYDLVIDMVRPGGLILADNVIWDGKVCQDPLPQDNQTVAIVAFNDKVSADPRVESVIMPIRDGLNIIRKK